MALRALPLIWVVVLALGAALGAMPAPTRAQQAGKSVAPPPQDRFLRIESGMHTARIDRIGVDAACTLLATGSDDKTVRLWRLPEGKLLRTLRPPIGPGSEGWVYSVALAPDGGWVAAGGWTANAERTNDWAVYIFETSGGTIVRRLGRVPHRVTHLAVSADGRYLAAVLKYGHGLHVWDTQSWQLIATDNDYGGEDSYGAAFDRQGVLYTVAYDGKLRRYEPGYKAKPAWIATRGGMQPLSIAVHPSGDRVAVGFRDTSAVDVYDAAPLAWRFAADTRDVTNGTLSNVAWSSDGERLYAGGLFNVGGQHPVRVWGQAGQGTARDLDGARSTVLHLLPCGSGMALSAQDPAFGLLGPDGSRRLWQESVQAALRPRQGADFAIAADSRRVRFALERDGMSPAVFNLTNEQLTDAPSPPSDLVEADTTSLPVADWFGTTNPKLAGAPITLESPQEWSRSLAVAPDKQSFILGGSWRLRRFDRYGKLLWGKTAPGEAWSVNVSPDGSLAIAGYGDGTIRWHRLSDGEELLALFVHKVDRRWVAWTPKGYYMASPGGESLIGWHVRRGWNEAAVFYAADRFREFNRPDIVKLVLDTLDERKAIEVANGRLNIWPAEEDVRKILPEDLLPKILPPKVIIQKPGDNATFSTARVTIAFDVFSFTGNKTTSIQSFVNNGATLASLNIDPLRALPANTRGVTVSGEMTLTLPSENSTVSIVAYEGQRASEPTSIRLRWDGARPGQVALPRLRALFVGIDAYTSPNLAKLRYARKDAEDLAAFFRSQEGTTYGKVETRVLADASRDEVIGRLDWLWKGSDEGDVNLLFLAGHGATIDQEFYYMVADSDPNKARSTAVSTDDIQRAIRRRKGTMVVMLDACRSGAGTDTSVGSPVDMNRAPNELGDKATGVLLYASASGQQYSYERAEWGNGAFTRAILDGLAGAADYNRNGAVETDELALYVKNRVLEMTKGQQEPVRVKPDAAPEMRLAVLK